MGHNSQARNPWLQISLSDYELHMESPLVDQASMLGSILEDCVSRFRPNSIALLGCSGGNGLSKICSTTVETVVGIDINPEYLHVATSRYQSAFRRLQFIVADLEIECPNFEPVELIFAGLLFEHVKAAPVLKCIQSRLQKDGRFATVLQLPSAEASKVTSTGITSLELLSGTMQLQSPPEFKATASAAGLISLEERVIKSSTGKRFQLLTFEKRGPTSDEHL